MIAVSSVPRDVCLNPTSKELHRPGILTALYFGELVGKWEQLLDSSFVTLLVCAELGLLLLHVLMFIYHYSAKAGVCRARLPICPPIPSQHLARAPDARNCVADMPLFC